MPFGGRMVSLSARTWRACNAASRAMLATVSCSAAAAARRAASPTTGSAAAAGHVTLGRCRQDGPSAALWPLSCGASNTVVPATTPPAKDEAPPARWPPPPLLPPSALPVG
jgi:hypothetical protein